MQASILPTPAAIHAGTAAKAYISVSTFDEILRKFDKNTHFAVVLAHINLRAFPIFGKSSAITWTGYVAEQSLKK